MAGIDITALDRAGLSRGPQTDNKSANELNQEQFLELMVTQLRNQDPFKPMESGEFLGQLAQFGTVSGIQDLQDSFQGLSGSLQSSQTLQAASLVGRSVLVPSHEAWLVPGGEVTGAVDNPDGARELSVGVYDLSGRLVATVPADGQGERAAFRWDGTGADGQPALPGFYEMRPVGRLGGEAVALDAMVRGKVESVSIDRHSGALSLTVTGLGEVDLAKVRQIG